MNRKSRLLGLTLAFGVAALVAGCGGDAGKSEYVAPSAATQAKSADMQKSIMENMKNANKKGATK